MKGAETDCNKLQVIPDNRVLSVVSASEEIPLQGNRLLCAYGRSWCAEWEGERRVSGTDSS